MSTREDRLEDARDWARDLMYGPAWDRESPAWLEACPHLQICETERECDRRDLDCDCPQAHEDSAGCLAWLRENPPDVDVRTELEDA